MDKKEAVNILLERAIQRQKDIKEAGKGAQERANEAEGAMQSRYDTFKEEGQYLAGGLKLIEMELIDAVFTLKDAVKDFSASNAPPIVHMVQSGTHKVLPETSDSSPKEPEVALWSLVTVDYENENKNENENESSETYFITPVMGGEKIRENITAIRPVSPVGRALMGKKEGEPFDFKIVKSSSRMKSYSKKGEIAEIS